MIYIGGNWENIRDLHDVARIINEYNHEFAAVIESLIPQHTDYEYEDLKYSLNEALDEIDSLEYELSWFEGRIDDLESIIDELKSN